MGLIIANHMAQNMTYVPNVFIDEYMPHANGSFVKVYLYLLRQDPSSDLTIESMADMLSNTEADIVRALRYWQKQGILTLDEADGQVNGICLLPLGSEVQPNPVMETRSIPAPVPSQAELTAATKEEPVQHNEATQTADTLPARHSYSPLQAEALKKDSEIESSLSIVEALLGTTLGDAHMQLILYLMSDLGFSRELVITLYETALSRGKSKPRYIEAIALDWAKKGIRTSKEAEDEASSFNGTYKIVASALGINRAFAPAEKTIIDKWENYHFSDAILQEACSRTVLQSGDTNLKYTTKILEDWHTKGVTSIKDIEDCDKSFFRQKNATGKKVTSINKNKFQNFPQREYSRTEYEDLEKQLLNH